MPCVRLETGTGHRAPSGTNSLAQGLSIIPFRTLQKRSGGVINTYMNYQLITRDMAKSLERVEAQPMVQRETEYYLANIGKVKSIEEFVADDRLFRYAMKAHGLEDMTYAKAFMVKALEGGVSDQNSFANKLTDKRYAEFVKSYNFEALGKEATVYNASQHGTIAKYTLAAVQAGVSPDNPVLKEQNEFYAANIKKVKSIKEFVANDTLFTYAMKAHGLSDKLGDKDLMIEMLEGGVDDPNSPANKSDDERFAKFVAAFNFVRYGEATTTTNPAQQPSVDKFARQTLEENAGAQNEGVRLALYFERNAPKIKDAYSILADTALAKVVRTALGLPDSLATADLDRQAKMISDRIDFADFQDPEALSKFMTRFTAMWEVANPSSTAQSNLSVLFSQPIEYGISSSVMMTLQGLKLGGS